MCLSRRSTLSRLVLTDNLAGIGGGRIPYDVNTALAPAALRSIAALARGGVYPHEKQWATEADKNAKVWEDSTLQFFEVHPRLPNYFP